MFFSKGINNYKGYNFVINIKIYVSEETYNKNPELHFERIDDK